MRTSTRPSFFALVIGLWIISCAIVFVSVLAAPPARGQAPETGEWSPREVLAVESAGEVVLKFTRFYPGRTVYYTSDCPAFGDPTPVSPGYCSRRPLARAGEDYVAVRGEWIFTEAGSRTITIPIIDDDLDEADEETFTIRASQHDDVAGTTAWYSRDIRIKDDDPSNRPISSSSPARSNQQSGRSQTGSLARPPAPPPATTSSSSEPTDSGNQSGVVNPGDPNLEVEKSAGDQAEMIAADTVGEDNFILMAGLRAMALVTIAAAGFALKKKFVRKKT